MGDVIRLIQDAPGQLREIADLMEDADAGVEDVTIICAVADGVRVFHASNADDREALRETIYNLELGRRAVIDWATE